MKEDFLDEIIREGTHEDSAFPEMVEAAYQRRILARDLASLRATAGLTQQEVADQMGTSQSTIARIEAGRSDVRLGTVQRYATVLGRRVSVKLHKVAASR